jgi:hypothetical protein
MRVYRTVGIAALMLIACMHRAGAAGGASAVSCEDRSAAALLVQGSTLCVSIDDPRAISQTVVQEWILRSARIVAGDYTRFPAPLVALRVRVEPGSGVRGGRTTNDSGLMIQVSVGRDSTAAELAADWVLVHEMVHLALPELGRGHNWLAEGLATYVEGIARAQSGNRDIADVWAESRHSMPLGLPHEGEGGMDQTHTWGRTYWGGALFCLQADVKIREQTGNRIGLQTALQAILKETGGYRNDRDIDDVLRIGDAATGTKVLEELYRDSKETPLMPDLGALWSRLGIPDDPKSQPFDDHAPLAAVRIAITRKL